MPRWRVRRRLTRQESWKYRPWYQPVTAVAAAIGVLPPDPVPSNKEAVASPVVVEAVAAVGPEVSPRVKSNVAVLKSVLFRRASSDIHPNFKLCEPSSLVMLACKLCV